MAHRQSVPMRRFERMSRLRDYRLEKGAPDPRGWKVQDGTGNTVGVVRDLVVDTDRMAAAYVDVELDLRSFDLQEDPRILVPMHRAHQEGRERRLVIPELTRSRVAGLYNARAEHDRRFWDEWWQEEPAGARTALDGDAASGSPEPRREHLRPVDAVRSPEPGGEWSERRRVHPDERMAAYGRDVGGPDVDPPPDARDPDYRMRRDVAPPDRDLAPRRDIVSERRRYDE
jgi:hypothetical protein